MAIVTIDSLTAFYPTFELGCEPQAIECELRIVEANGRRYLKTPFAMLDAYIGENGHMDTAEELARQVQPGRGYYPDRESCEAYLAGEYPHAKRAEPIMDALESSIRFYNPLVGASKVADKCGVSTDAIYKVARGHRSVSLKTIKAALAAIA